MRNSRNNSENYQVFQINKLTLLVSQTLAYEDFWKSVLYVGLGTITYKCFYMYFNVSPQMQALDTPLN